MSRTGIPEQLKSVPLKPGVYIFKDAGGEVLYVGKARSLRKRMRSYFRNNNNPTPKLKLLAERTADFEFYVVDNEIEALVLELTLIKKHGPPFNVSFRDDKSYPFIAVTITDEYPRVFVTREFHRRGSRYYGPYTNATALRETFDALRRIFPFRSCKKRTPGRAGAGPCLNLHIKRCTGPCTGDVEKREYREMIEQVCRFLEGRASSVIAQLEEEMEKAAAALEFERAAKVRDRLEAARFMIQRQKVVTDSSEDMDVIGLAVGEKAACANVSMVRAGKLLGSESFILSPGVEEEGVLEAFVKRYYADASSPPRTVLLTSDLAEAELVERWLTERREATVTLRVPKRGVKRELVELANQNARHFLDLHKTRRNADERAAERAALGLMETLGLNAPPRRIECFDVSTIQGSRSVGSMVVFVDGAPKRDDYRLFKVKMTAGGPDDFAMMREIITRRLKALGEGSESSFKERPDLMVVDGGRPQLSAALLAAGGEGNAAAPIVALAKRDEEVFMPGRDEPVRFAENSESLHLIMRLRDEAHRFALSFHRRIRNRAMIESGLDVISGVGESRKRLLISRFGSPKRVSEARLEELQSVPGLPKAVAAKVYRYYHDAR